MDKKFIVVGLLVCMYGLMIVEDNSYSHPIYGFGVPKDQGEFLIGLGLVLMAYGLLKKSKTQEEFESVGQPPSSATMFKLMLVQLKAKLSALETNDEKSPVS
jgi:hypothetical protein